MERTDEIKKVTIFTGLSVALFVLNTHRLLQAIEFCEECLIVLNSQVQSWERTLTNLISRHFFSILVVAYDRTKDPKSAEKYLRELLLLHQDFDDPVERGRLHLELANRLYAQKRYVETRAFYELAADIMKRNGDIRGKAKCYHMLGTLLRSIGENDKSRKYLEKALAMNIGFEKALAIRLEIGDRVGEAADYTKYGSIFYHRGEYDKAQEYNKKSLEIHMEIGHMEGVVVNYCNLGSCFQALEKYGRAEEHLRKALLLSRDIGNIMDEFQCLCNLTVLKVSQGHIEKAFSYLFESIDKFDTLRGFLKDKDQFKIYFLEEHGTFPYELLSRLLSSTGKSQDALYVEELRRARGLADLMAARYSAKEQISSDPKSWCGIKKIVAKETDCACLYISVGKEDVRFWILKATEVIRFLEKKVSLNKSVVTGLVPDLDEYLKESFRSLSILSKQNCEDRSLDDTESTLLHNENRSAVLRDYDAEETKTNLDLCYKIFIAPVADLLKEPEIIIVPDSCMYQIPFAALSDKGGKYFSETFRLRIVPSLSTLKLIQDSPSEYHSQTGALIVGDPVVGEVIYKDRRKNITPLPCARKEAEKLGGLLGLPPLIGVSATKQAVLEWISSVSLIHIAAHGSAERGEIALSPKLPTHGIPHEEDYLLTMADISQAKLRAKLVVLSCCHSARGQIKAEGVIGIARAFLGSGARSVLAARCALDDEATEQFMTWFYEHLLRGESVSESVHEARKLMRNNGFEKTSHWAPFMIIGDNVSFDFGNWPVLTES
ncbi:Tetratricopeptide repeat protein 28 [Stylophora pistillata]|uniref:Tetratricopeptide repeat protein 28 n=1 Tax=Stylophora pistillata TaxID=50429 RepID=A0A2B4RYB6_STYPI|nr:Tetratricopeptide repeat protein 28 [Stylophora pistillata]